MDWVWKGLVTNLLPYLGVLAVGTLVTLLQHGHSQWAQPILYGLGASAFAGALLASLQYLTRAMKQPPEQIKPETIEQNIRNWIDTFQLKSKKLDQQDFYFSFEITLDSRAVVLVGRSKKHGRYLFFQANIFATPERAQAMLALSPQNRQIVFRRLALEFVRHGIGYSNLVIPFQRFELHRVIPITEGFTEGRFVQLLTEMEMAITLALANFDEIVEPLATVPATSSASSGGAVPIQGPPAPSSS